MKRLASPLVHIALKPLAQVMIFEILLISIALLVIYVKHSCRMLNSEIQFTRNKRDEYYVEYTKLLLEKGVLTSRTRVESLAKGELEMVFPNKIDIIKDTG